jgi:hypothetical protein
VRAGRSGVGLEPIGLQGTIRFQDGAVPTGQSVLGSRITYDALPPVVRQCARLFGCEESDGLLPKVSTAPASACLHPLAPWAIKSLSDSPHYNALENSCNRMYL